MMKSHVFALLGLLVLAITSVLIGSAELSQLEDPMQMIMLSRVPRTLAVILAGVSLSVAGVLMQMMAQNKFVEPTTTGTVEWATLGILLLLIYWPQSPVYIKLIIACLFSMFGAASFLWLLSKIKIQSDVIVPLTGIMYAGIIGSVITFIAYQFDLIQAIWAWIQGDFSMIIKGRYELLWISAGLCLVAYKTADQFTLIGLGSSMSSNLGLNYKAIYLWGISIVALITGITVVNAGVIPFLGLVVPNLISLILGDNLRKSLPWIAMTGAALVLICDILARLVVYPYEVPVETIMGVIGSVIFLTLVFRKSRHA